MARTEQSDITLHRVGLHKEIMKLFSESPRVYYKGMATEFTSNQVHEIFAQEGDFGLPGVIGSGTAIPFDDFAMPYSITVTPKKRAIGFSVTTEAIETEQGYGVISRRASKLADSMLKGREAEVANHMNLATSTAAGDKGPDAVALASTSHPLADGSTWSNYGVSSALVTLGVQNLENAVQEIRSQKSHRGDPFPAMGPYILIVPPGLEMLAKRITGAKSYPQSNDNDPNPVGDTISHVLVNPYITSTTTWALLSSNKNEHGLGFLVRRGMRTDMWKDHNHDAMMTALTEIYTKFNRGARGFQYLNT